jgi:hypothetical protein
VQVTDKLYHSLYQVHFSGDMALIEYVHVLVAKCKFNYHVIMAMEGPSLSKKGYECKHKRLSNITLRHTLKYMYQIL